MAIGDYDATTRAARVLRALPEPGWRAIHDDVIAAVRSVQRGGWPLRVRDPRPGSEPGMLRVSDLAVSSALSRALAGDEDFAVLGIEVASEDEVLQLISVQLSCRYLSALSSVVERVRRTAESVLDDAVGSIPPIDISVVDIHR